MNRALLVGINYSNTSYPLKGCINDILLIEKILREKFQFSEITELKEEEATCSRIVSELEKLIQVSESGDRIYFHYSGHGSQYRDLNGDESDGLDEIIIGYDHNWSDRMIRDDDFSRIFSTLKEGVELVVVLDACHSGSGLRSFGMESDRSYSKSKYIESPIEIECPIDINSEASREASRAFALSLLEYSNQKGILISGCRSNQTSADAYIRGNYNGALTYCLVQLLEQNPKIQYKDLVERLNQLMVQGGFSQEPELNCDSRYYTELFLGGYSEVF